MIMKDFKLTHVSPMLQSYRNQPLDLPLKPNISAWTEKSNLLHKNETMKNAWLIESTNGWPGIKMINITSSRVEVVHSPW